MTPLLWHRALARCRSRVCLLKTHTSDCRAAFAAVSLPLGRQLSHEGKGRSDFNCSPGKVLCSGNFHSSAAWLAAANENPSHPEIPGSNLKPAPPSDKAVSGSPAGWGDPLQELPEQEHNRTGRVQDASARDPTPSGAEVQQPGLTLEVPEPNLDAQEIPLQSPRDCKEWASQDIPEEAPQHQMPGVPGDLIPPGVPPQVPQDPNSEGPASVSPDAIMSQADLANGDGSSGTDKAEPAGYWAGRVPGTPLAHPTDKMKG